METRDLVTAERETKVHCGLLYYCIDIVSCLHLTTLHLCFVLGNGQEWNKGKRLRGSVNDTTIVEVQSPVAQSSHNTIAKDVSPDESSGISLFQVSTAKADKP